MKTNIMKLPHLVLVFVLLLLGASHSVDASSRPQARISPKPAPPISIPSPTERMSAIGLPRAPLPSEAQRTLGPIERQGKEELHRYKESVLIPVATATKNMLWILEREIKQPIIASFVHESFEHDYKQIKDAGGASHYDLPRSFDALEAFLLKHRDRPIVMISHYDKVADEFQMKTVGPKSTWPRFSRAQIFSLKAKHHLILEVLACEIGQVAQGPMEKLFTPNMVTRIAASLKAEKFGELLAALGTRDNPYAARDVEIDGAFIVLRYTQELVDLTGAATKIEWVTRFREGAVPVPRPVPRNDSPESPAERGLGILLLLFLGACALIHLNSHRSGSTASSTTIAAPLLEPVLTPPPLLAPVLTPHPADATTIKLIQDQHRQPWASWIEIVNISHAKGYLDSFAARAQLSEIARSFIARYPGIFSKLYAARPKQPTSPTLSLRLPPSALSSRAPEPWTWPPPAWVFTVTSASETKSVQLLLEEARNAG